MTQPDSGAAKPRLVRSRMFCRMAKNGGAAMVATTGEPTGPSVPAGLAH